MIGLNKGIVIVLFIGWYFSHGKCDDFFMYHNEKINICNSQDSFIELKKEKVRLYKKRNAVYAVGKQSDIIKFLYDSNFRLKDCKRVNDKKVYTYYFDKVVATNGLISINKKIKLLPEDILLTAEDDVFSIGIYKIIDRMP